MIDASPNSESFANLSTHHESLSIQAQLHNSLRGYAQEMSTYNCATAASTTSNCQVKTRCQESLPPLGRLRPCSCSEWLLSHLSPGQSHLRWCVRRLGNKCGHTICNHYVYTRLLVGFFTLILKCPWSLQLCWNGWAH